MNPLMSMYFEYDAISEDLEFDDTEPSRAMMLQVRLCELKMEIAEYKANKKAEPVVYRKNPVPKNKKCDEKYLSDYRAFKHFLEDMDNMRKYNPYTLIAWKSILRRGITPRAVEKILRFSGYSVRQQRKWNKPPWRTRDYSKKKTEE